MGEPRVECSAFTTSYGEYAIDGIQSALKPVEKGRIVKIQREMTLRSQGEGTK